MNNKFGELVSHNLITRIKKFTTHTDMMEVTKDANFSYYTLRNIINRLRPICKETYPLLLKMTIIANRNAKKVSSEAIQISNELEEWQNKQDQDLLKRLKRQ